MRMVDLIEKKKQGSSLTQQEIAQMIDAYMKNEIPDYQMSAFLMAVIFQGMDDEETANLTLAMQRSGETIDLSKIDGIKVDKHSTGGVGDKTTLVLSSIVASLGIPVAKMSGRGLGHTGGTLDKLEAIPHFNISLSKQEFLQQVENIGLAVIGQSKTLVPADQRLYALRDVTGTVNSIPLIASSIMSKKLACGCDAILLDVKFGHGAFMKDEKEAEKLARLMIQIGKHAHKKVRAVISNMNEPLGYTIGNMLEVKEAVETLQNQGVEDFTHLCLLEAAHLLVMAEYVDNEKEAYAIAKQQLVNGKAYEKFKEMVIAQGGDVSYIEDFSKYPKPKYTKIYTAKQDGYLADINGLYLGLACMKVGAGRETKEDSIDSLAGMVLDVKTGAFVHQGDRLLTLYSNQEITSEIDVLIKQAYTYSLTPLVPKQVVETEVL